MKHTPYFIILLIALMTEGCTLPKMVKLAKTERKPTSYEVKVVYGTDRKPTGSAKYSKWYGGARNYSSPGLQLGTVTVSIPLSHKAGHIEKPSFWNVYDRENKTKYILLTGIDTVRQHALEDLRKLVNRSDERDAFIFIHGYNNSFEDAARRTAQFAFDLGFKGCPILFSWPSNGKVAQYMSDGENASWSVPHLRAFILKVIEEGKPQKLHIIAHSMGNKVLAEVLRSLRMENRDIQFNQIILAAPDIDVAIFKDQIVPQINGMAQRITMYCSSNDKALMFARRIRSDYARVGERFEPLYNGVETIDATSITDKVFDLNHSYINQAMPVINDIHQLFKSNAAPDQRALIPLTIPSGTYWSFKPNVLVGQ